MFTEIIVFIQARELTRLIHEMMVVLFGDETSQPHLEPCSKLTQEFFKEDILRLLVVYLPNLDPGVRSIFSCFHHTKSR